MKYSQFLEATEILESQGLSFNDIKEKDESELNEIFGINAALKNSFLTKYGRFSKRFKKIAEKLKVDISTQVKKSIRKYTQTKTQLADKIENIQKAGRPTNQIQSYNYKIETRIMSIVNQLSDKLIDIKTDEVFARIEKRKVKETTIQELKYVWEVLMAELKLGLLNDLYKQKILSSDKIVASIKDAKEKTSTMNDKKLKDLIDERKKEGKSEETTETTPPDEGGDFTSSEEL